MNKKQFFFSIILVLLLFGCKKDVIIQPNQPEQDISVKKQNSQNLKSGVTYSRNVYGTMNADNLYCNNTNEQIFAYAGNDMIEAYAGHDLVYGGKGSDRIFGGDGNDILRGDRGNDYLYGENGADIMYGGKDNDELRGNSGDDKLYGDLGNDNLYGGSENDTYHYYYGGGYDLIDDYSGWDALYMHNISTSQVSVSYSGNDVILTVPSGRITIKNNSVEGVYANGVKINILSNSSSIQGVPYFWQLDNSNNPYGSCQNTSIAMVLNYYGANTTPDAISNYYGTSQAQTVPGLQYVFNNEAAYHGLNVRVAGTTYGSISKLNSLLNAGKPVIAHGYTTTYGHVLVFIGFDGTYYYCNDPYGEWDGGFKSSGYYNTRTAGKAVKYHKNDIYDAFASDGYIWMHEIYYN